MEALIGVRQPLDSTTSNEETIGSLEDRFVRGRGGSGRGHLWAFVLAGNPKFLISYASMEETNVVISVPGDSC
jgi:hypothetical protein